MNLYNLNKIAENFSNTSKMPVLFIGHGSPMNAIEENEFTKNWNLIGKSIPKPNAILCISAHWQTRGTHITAMETPRTIHDFGGFPQALFEVQYPAKGNPELAQEIKNLIQTTNVGLDHDWGLDHGAWSVIKHLYPNADIPVLEMSLDYYQHPKYHYQLAKQLYFLRSKGVLIIGSGNMVHNLGMIAWDKFSEDGYAYDWAQEMNTIFKNKIIDGNHQALIDYENLSNAAKLAVPTPEHYLPLLYSLSLQDNNDEIMFFNDKAVGGSLTMTSLVIT